MRSLSSTLTAAQKNPLKPLCKLVLTRTGLPTITYVAPTRIIDLQDIEDGHFAKAKVLLDNSDKVLTDLDVRGYTGTVSHGFTTRPTETLRPNADNVVGLGRYPGASPKFNYDEVDDETPDEDVTYVYTDDQGVSYIEDLYDLPASTESGTINRVRVFVRCKADSAGTNRTCVRVHIKTNGTEYDGNEETPTTTYTTFSKEWTTNPQTGSAWTWNEIDALQIGVGLRGGNNLSIIEIRCTQVYVEVESVTDEYDAIQPMKVIAQPDYSAPGLLTCYLSLVGYFNLMQEDKANDSYVEDPTSTDTVKDLFTAVAGATLSVFDHCTAYTVIYDSEDSLIDTFKPKESFTVSRNESRYNVLKRLISWTECVMLMKADGKIHVQVPTIS